MRSSVFTPLLLAVCPSWSFPGFDSLEGREVSFLNYFIMQVIKSISSFTEVLRDLRGCGSLALPVAVVPDFVKFCNRLQVFPCGGALCGPESAPLQWLYID